MLSVVMLSIVMLSIVMLIVLVPVGKACKGKHSSLLGPFVTQEENDVL
jgi:hypothetical protein